MSQWVTDTHALLWYLYDARELSPRVKAIFAGADRGEQQILIPVIVLVEIVYLAEKGRIAEGAVEDVLRLLNSDADNYVIEPLDLATVSALREVKRDEAPDMPDRIIAATGLSLGLPVLTRDAKIQALSNVETVW